MNILEKIQESLNKIRPSIQADGGDVVLVNFDEQTGLVKVRLTGHCVGCPMAGITLEAGIAEELKQDVPEVKMVEAV
jgi:Fe-S cluster biogenesis protein NfuA